MLSPSKLNAILSKAHPWLLVSVVLVNYKDRTISVQMLLIITFMLYVDCYQFNQALPWCPLDFGWKNTSWICRAGKIIFSSCKNRQIWSIKKSRGIHQLVKLHRHLLSFA